MNTTFEDRTSTGKDEWLTPPEIVRRWDISITTRALPINAPRTFADKNYTTVDNGLIQPWSGRTWCNPPYGQKAMWEFTKRCVENKNATLLTFARTDTRLFHEQIFPNAVAILFIKGRLRFYHVDGRQADYAGAPSYLIAFDEHNALMLEQSGLKGAFVRLRF